MKRQLKQRRTLLLGAGATFLLAAVVLRYKRRRSNSSPPPRSLAQRRHTTLYPSKHVWPHASRIHQSSPEHHAVHGASGAWHVTPSRLDPLNNASVLHEGNAYPLGNVHQQPSQSQAPQIRDPDTTRILLNDPATLSFDADHGQSGAHRGFSVLVWGSGDIKPRAELVFLGEVGMFERYDFTGKGVQRGKLKTGKVSSRWLPYFNWNGERMFALQSGQDADHWLVSRATDRDNEQRTRTLQYLNANGKRRTLTRVPAATRKQAPTVWRRRHDDGVLVSDHPMLLRVQRHDDTTTLDTYTIALLDWQHRVQHLKLNADRTFVRQRDQLTMKHVPTLSKDGKRIWLRLAEGTLPRVETFDIDEHQWRREASVTVLGPNEITLRVTPVWLKDVMEQQQYRVR